MIPVSPPPEPPNFDAQARQPIMTVAPKSIKIS
jgi:hypothetical protein